MFNKLLPLKNYDDYEADDESVIYFDAEFAENFGPWTKGQIVPLLEFNMKEGKVKCRCGPQATEVFQEVDVQLIIPVKVQPQG